MVVMVVMVVSIVSSCGWLLLNYGGASSWCRNFVTSDVFKYAPCEKF